MEVRFKMEMCSARAGAVMRRQHKPPGAAWVPLSFGIYQKSKAVGFGSLPIAKVPLNFTLTATGHKLHHPGAFWLNPGEEGIVPFITSVTRDLWGIPKWLNLLYIIGSPEVNEALSQRLSHRTNRKPHQAPAPPSDTLGAKLSTVYKAWLVYQATKATH